MKRIFFSLLTMMMVAVCVSFTACSSDDDGNDSGNNGGNVSFATPPYESDAAKYVISNSGAPYKSIELTASGEYIVIPQGSRYEAKTRAEGASRASTTDIIYGKFTKTNDSEYALADWGTLKIAANGESSYTLSVTGTDGNTHIMSAYKKTVVTDSEQTNKLCRTWDFTQIRVQMSIQGRSFDKTVAANNMDELNRALLATYPEFGDSSDDFLDMDANSRVVLTKSGTYLSNSMSGKLEVGVWVWQDEANGVLRTADTMEHINSEKYSGELHVSFSGSNMIITYSMSGDGGSINMTYYYSEAKANSTANNNGGGNSSSAASLIGTWKEADNGEPFTFIFKSDKTGELLITEKGRTSTEGVFTWTATDKQITAVMTIYEDGLPSDVETVIYEYTLANNTLTLKVTRRFDNSGWEEYPKDEIYVLYKQ